MTPTHLDDGLRGGQGRLPRDLDAAAGILNALLLAGIALTAFACIYLLGTT